jgi:hypothetical protein
MKETVGRLRLYFVLFGLVGHPSSLTLMVYPYGDPATKNAHAVLSACSTAQALVGLAYVVIGARLPHLLGGSLRGVFATIFISIAVSVVTLLASLTVQATIAQFLPFLIGLAINIPLAQQTQRMATAAATHNGGPTL